MIISTDFLNFKKLKSLVDWKLLLFLVLFLNVKLVVKVPAIIIIYLLQFNFKFGFSLKNSRLPLFYLLVISIAVFNWLISRDHWNVNYGLVLLTGIGFWSLCILAMHQVKLSVERDDTEIIHRTIVAFFVLNAVLSLFNLAAIIIETGSFNPYTYQGLYQKYFIGTGDYIRGLTFDTSTTNAVLNAFGVIYFLTKKNMPMLFICMAVMLFTGSNYIDMVLLLILLGLFIFKSSRDQKSQIVICVMFLVVFMGKISPQNSIYVNETFKNTFHLKFLQRPVPYELKTPITLTPDSLLSPEQRREKVAYRYLDSFYVITHPKILPASKTVLKTDAGRIYIPEPRINTKPFQHIADTTPYQRHLLAFISTHKASLPLSAKNDYPSTVPGKAIGFMQTVNFLRQHPAKIMTGDGTGNFSSKLAFRASGFGDAGGYPKKYAYFSPDFISNHLDIYLDFFSKKTDFHSLTNNPDSVYDQLLAEYGILGLLAFLVYYLGYFLKHYKLLTYGLPILLVLLAIFCTEYWFEQLSIVLFFELLLLLNIKESSTQKIGSYAS
jgi:hypothetical protein